MNILPTFICCLNEQVRQSNLQDRLEGAIGSMDQQPFQEGELDLIWS